MIKYAAGLLNNTHRPKREGKKEEKSNRTKAKSLALEF